MKRLLLLIAALCLMIIGRPSSSYATNNRDCYPPYNLTIASLTGTTATISWSDSNPGANHWMVTWDDGSQAVFGTPSVTIYNLEPQTNYTVYVQSFCGTEMSDESEELEFTTPCESLLATPGLYYDFENDIDECVMMKRLTQLNVMEEDEHGFEAVDAESEGDYGISRTGYVLKYIHDDEYNLASSRFILNPMDFSDADNGATVDFMWYHQTEFENNSNDYVMVQYSTDGSTWTDVDEGQVMLYRSAADGGTGWAQYRIEIPDVANEPFVYFAFMFSTAQTEVGDLYRALYIDDMKVAATLDCPAPMNFAATKVTAEGAFVAWEEMGDAEEWTILKMEQGIAFGSEEFFEYINDNDPEEIFVSVDQTAAFIALDSDFDLYVRANCSQSETSDWSLKCTVTLGECSANLIEDEPYVMDFEDFSEIDEEEDEDYETNLQEALTEACLNASRVSNYMGRTGFNFGGVDEEDYNIHLIYNTTANAETRLVLPAFDLREAETNDGVMVSFNWLHQGSFQNAGTGVQVQYSLDGTNWVNVGQKVMRFSITSSSNLGWTKYEFYIPELAHQYALIAFQFSQGNNANPICYMDDIRLTPTECYMPYEVVASVMGTTAVVKWNPGEGSIWQVAYGDPDENPDEMTTLDEYIYGDNFADIAELESETTYAAYVRTVCDEDNDVFSNWSTRVLFTTSDCEAWPLATPDDDPLLYDFEEIESLAEYPCLVIDEPTYVVLTEEESGNHLLTFDVSGNKRCNLQMQAVDLRESEGVGAMVSFKWHHDTQTGNDKVQVQYSLDGTVWTNKGSAILRRRTAANGGEGWEKYSIYIPELAGHIGMVRIQLINAGNSTGTICYIDDLKVTANSCANPTGLHLVSQLGTTATVAWNQGDAGAWIVGYAEYDPEYPVTEPDNELDIVYENSAVLDEETAWLEANTTYAVFVKAVCDEGNDIMSDWSLPVIFTTGCEVTTLDDAIAYDFNDYSDWEEFLEYEPCLVVTPSEDNGLSLTLFNEDVDEDNICLMFDESASSTVRIELPAIDLQEEEYGTGVMVSFRWFHRASDNNNDGVKVQYKVENGNWTDATTAAAYAEYEGWRTYRAYIEALTGDYGYISLLFTENGNGACYLDNLNVEKVQDGAVIVFDEDTELNELELGEYQFATVKSGVTLTVTDYLSTEAPENLVIEDGARLITPNEVLATVETHIDAYTQNAETPDGYNFLAVPVMTEVSEAANMRYNEFDLYQYDNSEEEEWRNYEDSEFSLEPGIGYLYANSHNIMLSFQGEVPASIEDEEYEVYLTMSEGELGAFNLVGNPFTTEAYLIGEEGMAYYGLNADGSEVVPFEGDAIAPMRGIFVEATENQQSLIFTTTQQRKNGKVNISVNGQGGRLLDKAIISFANGPFLNKFMLHPGNTRLYFRQGNNDYAIVRSQAEGEMPVSFKAEKNGSYTLNINVENTEMDYLHLIDNLTGADVDLLQTPSYTFEAKTSDYTSRFRLVFSSQASEPVEEVSASFAYFDGSEWVISNNGNATLQVIDIMGRVISNETISGNANININNTPGVYMLRLVSGDSVKVQKVVVR